MPSLWKFTGLTPRKLVKLLIKKVGEDEVSIRSASLSYYFLLALFPLILFLFSIIGIFAASSSVLRDNIVSELTRAAPASASQLVHKVVRGTLKSSGGLKLAAGLIGALWAASSGMRAVVASLDVIYQANESRPWWKQKLLAIGLTVALACLMLIGLTPTLYGVKLGRLLGEHIGFEHLFRFSWKIIEWPISFAAMFLGFSILYYFAPDLEERHWHWVTPGGVMGVVLWLVASVGFRFYLHFFNDYSATYGSIGAVIILMLWLYITALAILTGAELNWLIENQNKRSAASQNKNRNSEQSVKAA